MDRTEQKSESFLLGMMLTIAGGFLDAYSYVARGRVFATAETGNIVLLGLNLAQGNFRKVLYYLVPITSYALGILAAEQIKAGHKAKEDSSFHWRQIVILAETLIIAGVAFIPQGQLDIVANSAVAFICSMQVESFRKVNGNPYATTMCTGNLRSGMEHLYHLLAEKDREAGRAAMQYFGIIGFFILGAILGVVCAGVWGGRAALVCCVPLLIVFVIMFERKDGKEKKFFNAEGFHI